MNVLIKYYKINANILKSENMDLNQIIMLIVYNNPDPYKTDSS